MLGTKCDADCIMVRTGERRRIFLRALHLGVFNLLTGGYSWLPGLFTITEDILNWEYCLNRIIDD